MDETATKKLKTDDSYEETVLPENGMINNLPNDCLLYIFSHLPIQDLFSVEKVCRRWEDLGANTWRHVKKLVINQLKYNTQYVDIIPRCGCLLEELELTHWSTRQALKKDETTEDPALKLLSMLVHYCKNLKKLTISLNGCTESECTKLCQLFLSNKNLKFIKLSNLSGIDIKCRNRLFGCLPEDLERIIFHRFSSDSAKCTFAGRRYPLPIQTITKFERLKYLELSGFKFENNDFIALENLNNLISLKLDYILKRDIMDITRLRHLEHLQISCYMEIKMIWFDTLVKNCQSLKSLKFKHCHKFDGGGLLKLSKLPKLESLAIINCGGPRMTADLSGLSNLKEFTYSFHRKQIGNLELLKFIGKAEDLKYLDISRAFVTEGFLDGVYIIMKNRNNHVKLEVLVSDVIGKQWEAKKIESTLLVVKKGTSYRAEKNISSIHYS